MFSHDWQLEWLLEHAATLEELSLDDCLIVHHARHYGDLDDEGFAVEPERDYGSVTVRTYGRRWASVFSETQSGLLKLNVFRFGIGPWF